MQPDDDDSEVEPTDMEGDTDELLNQLQLAADEHRRILERQSELISQLREELRGL